jgi:hypothetical protein
MTYLYHIAGTAIVSILLILITQMFTLNGPEFFPSIFIYWGIMIAALGSAQDEKLFMKSLNSIFIIQGILLLSLGLVKFFKTGYDGFYLRRAVIGLGVLLVIFAGYLFGSKET